MLIHRIAAQLYTAEALQDIEAALAAGEDATLAISQSGRTLAVAAQFARTPRPTVYIVSGEEAADRAARSLAAYVGVEHVARFPERKDYPWKSNEPDDAVVAARCAAMSRVAQGESCIMVASARSRCAASRRSRAVIGNRPGPFRSGEEIPFEQVPARLVGMGYTRADAAMPPASSACRAIPSKSGPPNPRPRCVSSSSAMRSTASVSWWRRPARRSAMRSRSR